MSNFDRSRARFAIRSVILATASFGLAACSSSVDRFGSYPPVNTASLPNKAPDTGVTRTPLVGAPKQGSVRPSWQQPANAYKAPVATTPTYRAAKSGSVTVQSGQTMYSLAKANGVSVTQLASANNIAYPYAVNVGQRLTVPGVSTPNSPAPSFTPQQPKYQAAAAPVPKKRNFSAGGNHKVRPGETLFSLGRTYNQNPYSIAKHNNLQAPYGLNVGQVVSIPGASGGNTMAKTPKTVPFQRKTVRIVTKNNDRIQPAPVPQVNSTPIQKTAPTTLATNSTFRWPVKGRVISSFGKKPGGLRNEGINIAVPAGTSVRSAESGIVAYAGNELKGYGNLVLIRHKNGWVTAYAHNKQLFVKRGDTVKRGTVIAKAGQTGSVTTPQLHFEVRKGASAVNPMKYLTSKTAALN